MSVSLAREIPCFVVNTMVLEYAVVPDKGLSLRVNNKPDNTPLHNSPGQLSS